MAYTLMMPFRIGLLYGFSPAAGCRSMARSRVL